MHAKLTGRWRGLAAVPMDNGTRTQYPQTTATPGPSKFRMQFPHDTNRCTLKNRKISTIRFQYLKYAQGNCMRNCRNPVRTQHHATTRPHRYRGAGGSAGPAAAPVDNGARLRCPWAPAGPGRTTSRRAKPHASTPGPTGVKGAGGTGGPGCGARGRWRGLAGLRDDAPSEARGADGERAGRRPRVHQAARPSARKR